VGITLFSNGLAAKAGFDRKSTAYMNILTALLLVVGNFIMLTHAALDDTMAFANIAAGLLFGFTYCFLAANHLWGLDLRAFGVYSLFASVFAIISGVLAFLAGAPWMGVLWLGWSLLWLEGFAELLVGHSAVGRYFPALSMIEGVFFTFIPGVLMLNDAWPM
jgi:acid-activated urea channel